MKVLKKTALILLFGLVSVLLQGTVLKGFMPGLVVPNLVLILVVFLAFHEIHPWGALLAFFLGLELDVSSAILLGPWAGAFVAVYGVIASLSQRIFIESPLAVIVSSFLSSLLGSFVYVVLIYQFKSLTPYVISTAFFEAILTAVVAPLVFKLLHFSLDEEEKRPRSRSRALQRG